MRIHFALFALLAAGIDLAAQPQPGAAPVPPGVKATIDVVAVTPVDGVGIDRDRYPAGVQILTGHAVRDGAANATIRKAASVQNNDTQGDRFQPDVLFRGAVASSLLGMPQGLAVFQDGVRLNEPFGDTVNLNLVPDSAIESVQLIPGANAAFGLNALGGVLSFRTRSGFRDPGWSARLGGGSFGASSGELEGGGRRDALGWFVALSHEKESGWRDFAPSRLDRLFARAQWARANSSGDLRLTLADTALTGNGATPIQLLEVSRSAVFTHPDETSSRTWMLSTSHDSLTRANLFEVTAFVRRSLTRTRNGDATPYEPCDDDATFLCIDDSDDLVLDAAGEPVRVTDDAPLDAVMNRSLTAQTMLGAAGQLSRSVAIGGAEHRLTAGLSIDRGVARFSSEAELANMTASRGAGVTGLVAADSLVSVQARTSTASLFVTDVVLLNADLTATLAARMNRSELRLVDQLGDDLTGDHHFAGVNPSLGLAWAVAPVATLFVNVGQSSRTPTPVELTCANPDDPCRLPNAFVSDPPLRQVVGRSAEIGVRGHSAALHWSVAAFATRNRDDILFISSGKQLGHGYFGNVGDTRRDGFEMLVDGRFGSHVDWFASFSYLDATFETPFVVDAVNHPFAEDGTIAVARGDRLPLIPRHTWKAGSTWHFSRGLDLIGAVRGVSSSSYRGDEANLAPPLPGYTVADLSAAIDLGRGLSLELVVRNVANASYATFGTFGDAGEVLGSGFDDSRFLSPSEPRSHHIVVSWRH